MVGHHAITCCSHAIDANVPQKKEHEMVNPQDQPKYHVSIVILQFKEKANIVRHKWLTAIEFLRCVYRSELVFVEVDIGTPETGVNCVTKSSQQNDVPDDGFNEEGVDEFGEAYRAETGDTAVFLSEAPCETPLTFSCTLPYQKGIRGKSSSDCVQMAKPSQLWFRSPEANRENQFCSSFLTHFRLSVA